MNIENVQVLDEAIAEAMRFIKKAESAKARIIEECKYQYNCSASKETGAVKRAAIDLGRICTKVNKMKGY